MDSNIIIIQWMDVLIALGLVAVALGLSYWQGFGVEKDLAWGIFRSLIQLTILGYVLLYIFRIESLLIIAAILVLMALVAAYTGKGRLKKPFPGAVSILWFSIMFGTAISVTYVTLLTMHDPIALTPQYIIPLGGMMIGNSLNGLSLGAERLRSELESNRDKVECLLSMGTSSDKAASGCVKAAFSASMITTINALMVIGLIQIPGIMTGQVLAGLDPLIAARYQLVIMFMIVFTKVITLSLGLRLGARKFFTQEHQLKGELL